MLQKATHRKAALAALLLAAVLLLGGCNLIVKDPEVDARQVILDINGETVDKAAFTTYFENAYDRAYQEQASMYQQYGINQQVVVDRDQVMENTLDSVARDKLLHQKAHELGLDELTAEEEKALEEKSQADYQSLLDYYQAALFSGSELTGEALKKAVSDRAAQDGITADMYLQSAKEQDLHDKLLQYAGRDLAVSEEEIQADYNAKVTLAKTNYEQTPSAYGNDRTQGSDVYFAPAGYRMIKQILIKYAPEDETAITSLNSALAPLQSAVDDALAEADRFLALLAQKDVPAEDADFLKAQKAGLAEEDAKRLDELLALETRGEAEQQEMDAISKKAPVFQALAEAQAALEPQAKALADKEKEASAKILPKAEEVFRKAMAPGADFDALAAEYNEDPGMPAEGYPVSLASDNFVPEFTKPAMALKKVGDVSLPSLSNFGFHILQYAANVPEGPVALDAVREAIQAELLAGKQEAAYTALETEWLAGADIKKYPERMKD